MNSSLDGSGVIPSKYSPNVARLLSPSNATMNKIKGHESAFESPTSSFSKKGSSIANELKKRLVNFTYSSPLNMKVSLMEQELQEHHFIDPSLERSAHPSMDIYRHSSNDN